MNIIGYNGSHRPSRKPVMSRAGDFGPGIYFASDIRDAKEYGHYVYQAMVTVKNPLMVGFELTSDMDRIRRALAIGDEEMAFCEAGCVPWHHVMEYAKILIDMRQVSQRSLQDLIRRAGYDSIYVSNAAVVASP
ncbi:unnamed protein product, partial [marine sediment metagenome]